jgi:hypothetical protein
MPRLQIPSIAGGPVASWKKEFCSGITKWSGEPNKSIPLEGSIGLNYSVKQDLGALFKACNEKHSCWNAVADDFVAALSGTLKQPTPGFPQTTKPITIAQMDILFDFVHWALGNQTYFLLRKGTETLGLCRRTSSYSYCPESSMPHRISFVMVSPFSEEKKAAHKSLLSRVPPSLVWFNYEVEEDTAETMASLARVRALAGALRAELDHLIQRLNE